MTTKQWRLVVTPLSGSTPLHHLEVAAPNWMGALRAARKELGEDGGLPNGASCAVAPDGTVTILDSGSRRKFVLTPGAARPAPAEAPKPRNGQARAKADPKRAFNTIGYDAPRAALAQSDAARLGQDAEKLELLLTRDEEPNPDNPLTYRERAYFIPRGTSVGEAEACLRFTLSDLQRELGRAPRGKLVNLAAFDHRWAEQPDRPPLIALEWRDWRGEPSVEYPAAERTASAFPRGEPDDRLASVFESLHELAHLRTPAEGLEFIVSLLETAVPSEATAACLYDINTDELRFVAVSGPGASALRGTAIARSTGLFGQAARAEHAPLVVNDVVSDTRYDAQTDGRTGMVVKNMVLRPVVHDGRLLGMLQLLNRQTGAFSTPDVHLVSYAADRLGEFLRDARERVRT